MEKLIDYYSVLRVPPRASEMEIKKSYRKLVLVYHPDRNAQGEQFTSYFLELQEAYEVLSDPDKRRAYDEKFIFHYGSLSTNYVSSADAILKEFAHLSLLSKDYHLGGYPKSMILDYFIYMIHDPHPQIVKEHLDDEDWSLLNQYVIDTVSIMHYMDIKDIEAQILVMLNSEGREDYKLKIESMKKAYHFQMFKPWLILLFSGVLLYIMYHFA